MVQSPSVSYIDNKSHHFCIDKRKASSRKEEVKKVKEQHEQLKNKFSELKDGLEASLESRNRDEN